MKIRMPRSYGGNELLCVELCTVVRTVGQGHSGGQTQLGGVSVTGVNQELIVYCIIVYSIMTSLVRRRYDLVTTCKTW